MDIGKLTSADESLHHQIADTFATVAESDLGWTEKIWGAILRKDGTMTLSFGLGKYQNRNVLDGFAGVSRGNEQWTVRASRRLGSALLNTSVGPIVYEIVEPLNKIRFRLAPNNINPIKMANLLWKDGHIAAMVDYEMAFNGNPRWDLAALLQGLRSADGQQPLPMEDEMGFWGEEHIIAQWQANTGRSLERLDWFRAADRARYAALLVHGQISSPRAGPPTPGLADWERSPHASAKPRCALRTAIPQGEQP